MFGRDQIGVYLYEDLRADPLSTLRGIFRFLEVDDAFVPGMSVRYNVSGVPRNEAVRVLVKSLNSATPVIKRFLPYGLRRAAATRTECPKGAPRRVPPRHPGTPEPYPAGSLRLAEVDRQVGCSAISSWARALARGSGWTDSTPKFIVNRGGVSHENSP